MEDGLHHLSVAQLVDYVSSFRFKLRAIPMESLVDHLVERAIEVVKARAINDEIPLKDAENSEADDGAKLHDEQIYNLIVGLLSSSIASARTLAGATYFLALQTAGSNDEASSWRVKLVSGCGFPRLVGLLSAKSFSVRYNSLLVLTNVLKNCPKAHTEFLRLGAVRKLTFLFNDAAEERQQNVCLDSLLCLCNSEEKGMNAELLRSQCIFKLVEWIGADSSERVVTKGLSVVISLLRKELNARALVLQLSIVPSLLNLLKSAKSDKLIKVALETMAALCENLDGGQHYVDLHSLGGVALLLDLVESAEVEGEQFCQVLRILTFAARWDSCCRNEITSRKSCIDFLHELLLAYTRVWPKLGPGFSDKLPLNNGAEFQMDEAHVAVLRQFFQVLHNRQHLTRRAGFHVQMVAAAS
eukprot:TRINITY_DN12407_c0_g1_i1.p1 TRINITY_DN12407_c0_g1~~TRINITY_DN12407_c0_g1_i1.p1  ORF type:complete len:414 (+),score=44.20 TRINITY_DN12407_c0_g1_i1:158-1399(+)